MNDIYILGIESSCDEMSASIVKNGNTEIKTIVLSQMDIHKKYGGVVPEIASRCHIESATIVLEELFSNIDITMNDITAIAVTYGPGLIGSLLVGLQIAKTLSLIYNKPLVPVHHIAGHIYANNLVNDMKFPLISLVVSGGHTDIIYMKEHFSFKKIGGTLDDAIGECYDKVARVMGLSYPGGPLVDNYAHKGYHTYNLPIPLDDDSYNFSFSGIKSAVINLVHNENQRGNKIKNEDLATSFQDNVVEIITKKTIKALKEFNTNNLIISGGVAANKGLREKFDILCKENSINLTIPKLSHCTDNAAMIACAGFYAYKKGLRADMSLNGIATDSLNDYLERFSITNMFDLTYLKDYNKYSELVHDVELNFSKYKKALYSHYKDNNEVFYFDEYPFCNELLLVIYLNEYEYPKEIVIKSLDNLLNNISNNMHKVLILNFLLGFGIINKPLFDERNPYSNLLEKI